MSTLVFVIVLISAIFHALWNFVTKQVAKQTGVYILGIAIAGLLAVLTLLLIPVDKTFPSEAIPYFLLTGFFHIIYFTCLVKAYRFGDFSTAYPLARGLGILGTSVLAVSFFHEKVSFLGIFGIISILIGILFLGLFSQNNNRIILKSYLYALGVGIAIVGYSLVDKQGVGLLNPVWQSVGVFTLPTFILFPYALMKHRSNLQLAIQHYKLKSFIIGFGSFTTYLAILSVLKMSQVSYVVAAREFAVAIGAILGFILLKEQFNRSKAWGIALVTFGLILIKLG